MSVPWKNAVESDCGCVDKPLLKKLMVLKALRVSSIDGVSISVMDDIPNWIYGLLYLLARNWEKPMLVVYAENHYVKYLDLVCAFHGVIGVVVVINKGMYVKG